MLSHLQGKSLMGQEAENRQGDRVTIEPHTFCYMKEIEQRFTKIQLKANSG